MLNHIMELYNEIYYYYIEYSKIYYNNVNSYQNYYYYSDISNQICSSEKDISDFNIDWEQQISEKKIKDKYNIYVSNLYRDEYANILNNNNNI